MVVELRLMGRAEVADALGVTKGRVGAISELPTPIEVLECGPIWDAVAILEFAATWDRKPGRPKREPRWHYVEMTYVRPGRTDEQWHGVLTEAISLAEAKKNATEHVLSIEPDATSIEVFLHRRLTERTADRIRRLLSNGTWEGWYGLNGPGLRTVAGEPEVEPDDADDEDAAG